MGHNRKSVYLTNETGKTLRSVHFEHRYDNDAKNPGYQAELAPGQRVEICVADFWTGFMRVGFDYWYIQFEMDGDDYRCKSNFFCYLTADDAKSRNPVEVVITDGMKMQIKPPVSSSCKVSLRKYDRMVERITQEHAETGDARDEIEDKRYKCA